MREVITKLKPLLPVIAFFAGFVWDALTIGRQVRPFDLLVLSGYLLAAGVLLWWLGYRNSLAQSTTSLQQRLEQWPYLLMQFLFGGLFSALFIFYIKSASHLPALFWCLGLALLLIGNEFVGGKYRRFTLPWALFGLCAMLLFNFLLPHLAGSIHFLWFYLSTLAGAALAWGLHRITPGRPGRMGPVWLIASVLAVTYPLDIIPPVPLVKREVEVGLNLQKVEGDYQITQDRLAPWKFWMLWQNRIHLPAGERLYCVSSVFAPAGLNTRLYHRWQYRDPQQGWQSMERMGFGLEGGRDGGFRGYTYKQNVQPGVWRISVETEYGRTVAVHKFLVKPGEPGLPGSIVTIR